MEGIWHTKKLHRQQMAGIWGFCFTNGYLAMKYFKKPSLPHYQFNIAVANTLVPYKKKVFVKPNRLTHPTPMKQVYMRFCIGYFLDCCYCNYGYGQHKVGRNTKSVCWDLQSTCGIPKKTNKKRTLKRFDSLIFLNYH